ncbi:MAG: type II secretion system F family protein [Peptostreptococcaceae bacterium]|nr:type II secretion system F family protein [Peptostreptococcaceae bacterium]
MPAYQFTELDKNGKVLTGQMVAEDRFDVIQSIKGRGNKVLKIVEREQKSKDIGDLALFKARVTTKDLFVFCKQMHTMLSAGLPLINAITVMASQSENKTLRQIFTEMQIDLQKGMIFSETMRKHKEFPSLLLNMIEAGEMTGNLDEVLEKMAVHYEKENKINAKIRAAMIYPIVLAVVAVAVIIFVLVGLMPMFVGMFQDAGADLPALTKFFLALSNGIKHYWYIFLIVITVIVFLISRVLSTTEGKRSWNRMSLRLPAIGNSIRMIFTSRFTRTLSTLLGSGISIVDGLTISARVTNNQLVIDHMEDSIETIKKGDLISTTLARTRLFPPMMTSMISIGEESGNIEGMLGKTADYYDQELDEAITKLVSLVEPMMILVMGGIIGLAIISILMPMFDMVKLIK